jgi:hypothetical protein
MAFNPTSPVTGATSSVLTSPTYTVTADTAPAANAKQVAVTALGGTQSGVSPHSASSPFTGTMFRPTTLKTLQPVNPVTGVLRSVPMNDYTVLTRKGMLPLAGQAVKAGMVRTVLSVPAGADLADPNSLAAMISFHIGLLTQLAEEIRKTAVTGTI